MATDPCNLMAWPSAGKECKELLKQLDTEVRDLNLYDILDPCYHRDGNPIQSGVLSSSPRRWPLGGAVADHALVQKWADVVNDDAGHPPCLDHRCAYV